MELQIPEKATIDGATSATKSNDRWSYKYHKITTKQVIRKRSILNLCTDEQICALS